MPEAATWQLAQVNVALPLEPLTSESLADFVALLEPVNALADQAPGFVWRLQSEDGDATAIRAFDDDRLIINMSVWESVESLAEFVFGGMHIEVMRRRREWFALMRESYAAAWWMPAGVPPTVADAEERLAALRLHGPTPFAFSLKHPYPAPGGSLVGRAADTWLCPA